MKTNRLLLIRLDGIGDYILFRNFIPIVKQSELFKVTHVTLVGNLVFKEFAETFDKEYISNFIWVDIERFYYSSLYRLFIYKKVVSQFYEVVINPMYSRHPSFDKIIKYSRANNKIGFYGDLSRSTEASRSATTKYYTNIFHSNPNTRFEFEVNKSFFEYILQKKILLSKPNIETSFINCDLTKNIIPNSKPYIIVFPGGSHSSRKYSSNNYSVIINHILRNTSYNIMVLGSESDKGDCNEIMEKVGANDYRLINLCGKTNLIELVYYIKTAALLISNDTSAVHIGAATNTKVITISNGQHIGRFSPYPSNIFADNIAVYPPAIQEQFDNKKELNSLYNKFSYGSNLNINDIDPFQIICKVEYLLNT